MGHKIIHLCLDVPGAFRVLDKEDWEGLLTDNDGKLLSPHEAMYYFHRLEEEGLGVVPLDPGCRPNCSRPGCTGFDYQDGCSGHRPEDSTQEVPCMDTSNNENSGPAPAESGEGRGGLTPQTAAPETGRQASAEVVELAFEHATSEPAGSPKTEQPAEPVGPTKYEAELERRFEFMKGQRDLIREELRGCQREASRVVANLRERIEAMQKAELDDLCALSWDEELPF